MIAASTDGRRLRRHRHLRQQRQRHQPDHRADRHEAVRSDVRHQHPRHLLVSQSCMPHLTKAANPHILNLSPPLNMEAKWFGPHRLYDGEVRHEHVRARDGGRAEIRRRRRQRALAADGHRDRGGSNLLGGDARCALAASPRSWPTPPTRSSPRLTEFTGHFCIDDKVLRGRRPGFRTLPGRSFRRS